jgi:hypothetical protein
MNLHWLLAISIGCTSLTAAQDDPGKADVGRVSVTVYHASNSDFTTSSQKTQLVSLEMEKRLRSEAKLNFKNYRFLGQDAQPVLRSYESWAQPLKPSDEILVKFEARSLPTEQLMRLDLELWLSRKKILKTDARLEGKQPLLVLGPEWRGGRLIIAVALVPPEKPGP